jgi:tetratricopeptide (TPR) repeat protein
MKRLVFFSALLCFCFLVPWFTNPGSRERTHWQEVLRTAQGYEHSGKITLSNSTYRELLRKEPALEPFCRYFMAGNYESMSEPAKAVREYEKILSRSRKSSTISFDRRALVRASLNRLYHLGMGFEAAEKVLRRSARNDDAARLYLFRLFLRKGVYDSAAELARDVLLHAEEVSILSLFLREILEDYRVIEYLNGIDMTVYQLFALSYAKGLYEEAIAFSYFLPDDEVMEKRAFALYELGEYGAALSLFEELYANAGAPEFLLWIAFSQYHLGQYGEANGILERYQTAVLERIQGKELDEGAGYLDMLLSIRKSNAPDTLKRVYSFVTRYQGSRSVDRPVTVAFYRAFTSGEGKDALYFLEQVSPYLKSSYYRSWASYVLGIYIDPSSLQDAVELQPDSYHGLRARALLTDDAPEDIDAYEPGTQRVVDILDRSILHRFLDVGCVEELEEILSAGLTICPLEDRVVYEVLLSKIRYARGEYLEGVRYAESVIQNMAPQSLFSLPPELLSLLYPRVYEDEIDTLFSRKDREYDCHLVLAIMREESRYDRLARSSRGALGLMQLMPDTASWILKKRLSAQELYDPETNLEASLSYLDYLFERFDALEHVIASYNGGPTVVASWVRSRPALSVEKFVEEVPYPETRSFVKKVYTSYLMYNYLYGDPRCTHN